MVLRRTPNGTLRMNGRIFRGYPPSLVDQQRRIPTANSRSWTIQTRSEHCGIRPKVASGAKCCSRESPRWVRNRASHDHSNADIDRMIPNKTATVRGPSVIDLDWNGLRFRCSGRRGDTLYDGQPSYAGLGFAGQPPLGQLPALPAYGQPHPIVLEADALVAEVDAGLPADGLELLPSSNCSA